MNYINERKFINWLIATVVVTMVVIVIAGILRAEDVKVDGKPVTVVAAPTLTPEEKITILQVYTTALEKQAALQSIRGCQDAQSGMSAAMDALRATLSGVYTAHGLKESEWDVNVKTLTLEKKPSPTPEKK